MGKCKEESAAKRKLSRPPQRLVLSPRDTPLTKEQIKNKFNNHLTPPEGLAAVGLFVLALAK